ncbi:hypothetical protein [Pseudomonas syringae group genomosp. 7]|uniref:hypothetical protein n=1 Tax=Pseudomonas syringae group genomosp. 7 TaxID=251699 RepID=UPI00376F8AD1
MLVGIVGVGPLRHVFGGVVVVVDLCVVAVVGVVVVVVVVWFVWVCVWCGGFLWLAWFLFGWGWVWGWVWGSVVL